MTFSRRAFLGRFFTWVAGRRGPMADLDMRHSVGNGRSATGNGLV
jgi:hypothetical protein